MTANGVVIYDGPSLLDGSAIIVVVTGIENNSSNSKTGTMLQTWILMRDIDPREANKSGADFGVCGNCPLRGIPHNDPTKTLAKERACFVTIFQAPLIVWKTYHKGGYDHAKGHSAIADIGKDRRVRLGSYGDPASVPAYIWDSLLFQAEGHTGYSHQSNLPQSSFDPQITMLSADSLEQAEDAWSNNIRTFRVINTVAELQQNKEILCPASKEAGKRTTCKKCLLCSGSAIEAKSIAIVAHGNGAKYANVA